MSDSSGTVPVVCALLLDVAGRVLVAQRPAHKHLGLKWEFPGGKVEQGEAPQFALVREISEELGCGIRVGCELPRSVHDYGSVVVELIPFVCSLSPGTVAPHPREHAAIRWVQIDDLSAVDLAPADVPVVRNLLAMLRPGPRTTGSRAT